MFKITTALILVFAIGSILQFDDKNLSAFGAVGPIISITSPANHAQVNNNQPTIQGITSDSTSVVQKVQVKIDSNAYVSAMGTTSWSYTPSTPLASSSHTVIARATDNAGNVATSSVTFTIDIKAPTISITSPTNHAQVNNNQPIIQGTSSDSGSGVQKVEVVIDGGSYVPATGTTSWSYTPSTLSTGLHTVTARVIDKAGNVAIKSITFTIDTTPPTISITSLADNTQLNDNTPTIKGTSSDSGSGVQKVEVVIDGGSYVTATGTTSWSYTPSTLSTGSHTVTARATDKAGNVATTSSVTFTIDTTPPTISITSPTNNAQLNNNKPIIKGITSDSGSGVQKVQVKIDSNTYVTATGTTSWSYTPSILFLGLHTVTAKVTDNAGNVATSSITFTVDTKAPTISITSPAKKAQINNNQPTIQGTSSDSGSGVQQVQVIIDDGTYVTATGTTSWSYTPLTPLSSGSHTVTARATDNAGNAATSSLVTFTVDTTPPTISITSPTNNAQINNNQPTIQGESSDSGSGLQQVQVSFDDGTYVTATGTTSWSYTPSTPLSSSSHTVTARVTDKAGNAAKSLVTFTVYTTTPSSPQNLQATGSNTQVSLTWQQAPLSNGGSAITNYKIYRSLESGNEVLHTTVGNVLSYNDTGLTNGQTYYYKVSAVNSVGESSQSNEASASPTLIPIRNKIILSFVRPDLDPKSLANVVIHEKSFSKTTDFVFGGGISGFLPKWKVDATVPGQLMVGGAGNNTYSTWQSAKILHGVKAVFFDEEPTLSLADVEAGYATAHSLGLKFVTTPTYTELAADPSVVTTVAQNSDIFNLQIYPGQTFVGADKGLTYDQCIQKYELAARQANPNIKIFVEYITGPNKTNTGDMTKQIDAFNSIKSYVDGVFIWYYQTPDPTPVLKQFYKGTGLVG